MKWSPRFGREVYVTRHARERMVQRGITEGELEDLLEKGEVRYKDPERLWIAIAFPERKDNLICAPVALEESVVVKTLMHYFEWGE